MYFDPVPAFLQVAETVEMQFRVWSEFPVHRSCSESPRLETCRGFWILSRCGVVLFRIPAISRFSAMQFD